MKTYHLHLHGLRRGFSRRARSVRYRRFAVAFGVMLMLGMTGLAVAQDGGPQPSQVSSYSISTRRNRSIRNLRALQKIWS